MGRGVAGVARWGVVVSLLGVGCAGGRAANDPTPPADDAGSVDATTPDPASGSDASGPAPAADAGDKAVLGSKCLTKCPDSLVCDETKWKGMCTHACATDDDCGDAGILAVCVESECYRACTPGSLNCQRELFECVGPPGHTYCTSSPDAGICAACPHPPADAGASADGG
jgi:hypothetical protein